MPVPTPFHDRTARLCTSMFWKDWAGCFAVRSYDTTHEREYFAIRHAAALIDVSPLYKYEVSGPDAARFLSRVTVRNISKLAIGRVTYLCWCDDQGKVVDDGTVSRLGDERYRVTAAEPSLSWLRRHAHGYHVSVEDTSREIGALSLQGPNSRAILEQLTDADLGRLRFFRVISARLDRFPVEISRTGYTGDLGYEIWVGRDDALAVYDLLIAAGRPYRVAPVGLDAMDVSRIEAGFIMNGVDYFSANHCLIESRKSTPFEIGLGWTVDLDRDPFNGQAALRAEQTRGSRFSLVGLEYDWDEFEALFAEVGLPPRVPPAAWRDPVPVYHPEGTQVGQATSGAWSPTLKRNLALACVEARFQEPGTRLSIEVTVEYRRRQVAARVVKPPFFDPPRKRA